MSSLLISRLVYTAIVFAVGYFCLNHIWTKRVDIMMLFKGPADSIPVIEEEQIDPDATSGVLIPANETYERQDEIPEGAI
ncbi:MAG: hypothetical protein AAGB35_09675, partial [Pseudomonadota bacterium]